MDEFRCLIIAAADAEVSRAIAMLFGPGGVGMWTVGLSPTGQEPATHYISSGFVPEAYGQLSVCTTWSQDDNGAWIKGAVYPGSAATVAAYASQAGLQLTADQVQGIFNRSDVTAQEPFVAMGRLGLKIVNPPDAG